MVILSISTILLTLPHIILFYARKSNQKKHGSPPTEIDTAFEIQCGEGGTRRKENPLNNERERPAHRRQVGQGKQSCSVHEGHSFGSSLWLFQLRS